MKTADTMTARGPYEPLNPGPRSAHCMRYYRTDPPSPHHRDGGVTARCDAGDFETTIDGGHTGEELADFARQHGT